MFLGPRIENPDQPIRDPSDIQGALTSLELEAITIPPSHEISLCQESVHTSGTTNPAPPAASIEPPTQSGSDSTSTPTDNHAVGSPGTSGYTTNGPDKARSKKDSTRSNLGNHKPLPLQEGRPKTVLPSDAAPDQPTFLTGLEEWPQLPGQNAQHIHGPSPKSTSVSWENPVVKSTRAPPTAIKPQEHGSQETATDSADRAMASIEKIRTELYETPEPITSDTASNAPGATQLAPAAYTLTKRQRKAASSTRLSKSSTACFGFDTPILMELLGFAY